MALSIRGGREGLTENGERRAKSSTLLKSILQLIAKAYEILTNGSHWDHSEKQLGLYPVVPNSTQGNNGNNDQQAWLAHENCDWVTVHFDARYLDEN